MFLFFSSEKTNADCYVIIYPNGVVETDVVPLEKTTIPEVVAALAYFGLIADIMFPNVPNFNKDKSHCSIFTNSLILIRLLD